MSGHFTQALVTISALQCRAGSPLQSGRRGCELLDDCAKIARAVQFSRRESMCWNMFGSTVGPIISVVYFLEVRILEYISSSSLSFGEN